MKKKIGLLLDAIPRRGGTFQYSQSILEAVAALQPDEYSVVVVYTSELWEEHLQSFGVKKTLIPRGFWGRAIFYSLNLIGLPVWAYRRLCPSVGPLTRALIHEQCDLWIFPSQDAWSFIINVPALVSIHDLMHRYQRRFPEVSARGEFRRREYVYKNICKKAKGVIADSATGKEQVIESYGLHSNRVHILPFVAPKYIYASRTQNNFDSCYSLPPKFIFYPAQFWEHKNHKILIRAVARLKEEMPDIKMVFIGSKKNGYDSVVSLINVLGVSEHIHLLGYVRDEYVPEIYRRARALIMPTFFGPTNIPPLEAFATGCPAAVSRIYGMPEQVGDAALLFDPESLDAVSDVIVKLWRDDNLCNELRTKGLERAKKWTQVQFNQRFAEIVGKVLQI